MGSHKCCCPEGPGGECDCDCASGVCEECCWHPGDLVEYDHDFRGSYSVQKTQYPFGFNARHTCGEIEYTGGQVVVRYACVGCINCPVVDGIAYVFALLTAGKEAVNADKIKGGKFNSGTFIYDLPNYLLLTCRTEDGQKEWFRSNTGTCGEGDLFGVQPCVQSCESDCTNIPQESCITGLMSQDFCDPDLPATVPVDGPDSFNCPNCVDELHECGGFRAYCAFREVDSECAHNGNAYGLLVGPPSECGYGCETDMVTGRFWPPETCAVKMVQTLTILPPAGSDRSCRWFEEDSCCKSRKSEPAGGTDVTLPDALDDPQIDDYSFPDDWTGDCDCDTPREPVTSSSACFPPACPESASEVAKSLECL